MARFSFSMDIDYCEVKKPCFFFQLAMTDRQKAILKAMEAVKKGASVSAAARQFNIARSTLDDKIRGRSSVECSKGPSTILTSAEEEHLKRWIIFMADSGFPITKAQLLDSVSLLVKKMKRDNPFQNDRPGRHWFESFIQKSVVTDITNEDWFCRLCQRSKKLDMIQCVSCKTWYHTICAEVSPNEVTFTCLYCNVSFDV